MVTKVCKICGKSYDVCPACESVRTFAPWRTIVCSSREFILYELLSEYDLKKDAEHFSKVFKTLDITDAMVDTYRTDVRNRIYEINSLVSAKERTTTKKRVNKSRKTDSANNEN